MAEQRGLQCTNLDVNLQHLQITKLALNHKHWCLINNLVYMAVLVKSGWPNDCQDITSVDEEIYEKLKCDQGIQIEQLA